MAVVNPRAAGVVREIHADQGSRVSRGSPLAVLESSAVGEERSRLLTARARAAVAESNWRRQQDLYKQGVSAKKEAEEAELAALARALPAWLMQSC